MRTSKVVTGVLAGIFVGSILGILFAPEKGSDTRNKIRDKRNEFLNKFKLICDDFSYSLKNRFENKTEESNNVVENKNDEFENVKNIL